MGSNKEINTVLGTRVKTIRNLNKITREELAEKIDVSARFLADVESGKVGVSLATLIKLCSVLNTTSDYLLGITTFSTEEQRYINIDKTIKNIPINQLENAEKILSAFLNAINEAN